MPGYQDQCTSTTNKGSYVEIHSLLFCPYFKEPKKKQKQHEQDKQHADWLLGHEFDTHRSLPLMECPLPCEPEETPCHEIQIV